MHGKTAVVRAILDRGADVHAYNDGAFRLASQNGHTATVAILLDRCADVHALNDRALRLASQRGHFATVALLLDRGADVHVWKYEALMLASLDRGADHAQINEALRLATPSRLDRGADVHAALSGASWFGHTDTVALLKSQSDRG
jgi:ankyrin repeat protein